MAMKDAAAGQNPQLSGVAFKGNTWFDKEWMPITETTEDYLAAYWEGFRIIASKIDNGAIEGAVDALLAAWRRGASVFVFGNGGSAGNASHFAADLAKTTMAPGKKGLRALCLNDNASLTTAWVNDEGWGSVYEGQLQNLMREGDVCIALSVHGGSMAGNAGAWSQNLMRALQYSRERGGVNIGIAGFGGGGFAQVCQHCIVVPLESTMHVEAAQMMVHHAIVGRLVQLLKREGTPGAAGKEDAPQGRR